MQMTIETVLKLISYDAISYSWLLLLLVEMQVVCVQHPSMAVTISRQVSSKYQQF